MASRQQNHQGTVRNQSQESSLTVDKSNCKSDRHSSSEVDQLCLSSTEITTKICEVMTKQSGSDAIWVQDSPCIEMEKMMVGPHNSTQNTQPSKRQLSHMGGLGGTVLNSG